MIVLFTVWFPLIKGLLLIILGLEQLYLFRFIYLGYQIVRDKSILVTSTSFLAFSVGSFASSLVSVSAFTYLSNGAVQEGSQLISASDTVLSTFEIVGFCVFLIVPFISRARGASLSFSLVPMFVMGLHNYRLAVNSILAILIVMFFVYIAKNAGRPASLEIYTVLGGLVMLAFSKIIAFIPVYPYSLGTVAILLEVMAFFTFIFLREIISTTLTLKPTPQKGDG
ncbi:MAG: hypothetical protein ACE5GD_10170 [Candidatus Geothermarchaeales archaeon]